MNPSPGSSSSTTGIVVGVIAMVVGVAAIALQDAYKLDAEAILTGGNYLKDGPRNALLFGGAITAVLGLALLIVSSTKSGTSGLLSVTLVVALLTGAGLALCVVGVASEDKTEQTTQAEAANEPSPNPPPQGEASGDAAVGCGSGGCMQGDVYVYGITEGDGCIVASGAPGEWASIGTGTFRCNAYGEVPSSTADADPIYAVACPPGRGCFQRSQRVTRPIAGSDCPGMLPGVWAEVRLVAGGDGQIYRCNV